MCFLMLFTHKKTRRKVRRKTFTFIFIFLTSRVLNAWDFVWYYQRNRERKQQKKNSQFLASCGNPKDDAWKIIKLNKIDAIIFIVNASYGNYFSCNFNIFYCNFFLILLHFFFTKSIHKILIICSQPDEFFFPTTSSGAQNYTEAWKHFFLKEKKLRGVLSQLSWI